VLEGRPLYDTEADRRFFLTPPVWQVVLRAIDRGNNVLLSAPWGWGKTSLLRQLERELREHGEPVAFIDATGVDGGFELLLRVRHALPGSPSLAERMRSQLAGVSLVVGGDLSPPMPGMSYALVEELRALEDVPPTRILVDASGSAPAVYEIFGRLRDAVWQLPHRWCVAVNDDERATALKPPADAFFDIVLEPAPWSVDELVEILARRGLRDELDDESIRELATASRGTPRAALRSANEAVVTGRPASQALAERAELLRRARELGVPHGTVMAAMLDLGQASASDDAFLGRVGVSRSRATALLRELLQAGLVETDADTGQTRGRPKTIYRPALTRGSA
jgi:hypothetical protein